MKFILWIGFKYYDKINLSQVFKLVFDNKNNYKLIILNDENRFIVLTCINIMIVYLKTQFFFSLLYKTKIPSQQFTKKNFNYFN